eukprot:TRINITY_DN32295_c0_g1_i1.p1 TRINITY_DN32295_c0_g1~~TRINITY_DN32295_c0_g1_i1.p1  ORF type:complete len:529 (+),score=44.64 TRINITY_DN32295_c0_g1_i1:58-1644(+)
MASLTSERLERPLQDESPPEPQTLPRLPSRRRLSMLQLIPDFSGGSSGWRHRRRSARLSVPGTEARCRRPSIAWLAPSAFLSTLVFAGPTAFLTKELLQVEGIGASVIVNSATALRGLVAIIISPFLGALSDRLGRKPILVSKAVLLVLFVAPMAFLRGDPSLRLNATLVLMVVLGLSGSMFGTLFAYCADLVLLDSNRTMNGTVATLLAVSFTPGMIIAGPFCIALHHKFGNTVMWQVLFAAGALNAVYTAFVLPESLMLDPAVGGDSPMSPASPASSPISRTRSGLQGLSLNPFIYFRLLSRRGPAGEVVADALRRTIGVLFLLYFAKWSLLGTIVIFAEARLNWHPEKATLLITTWGISQFISFHVLAIFASYMARRGFGSCERAIAWGGLISGLAGMILLIITTSGWTLFPAMGIGAVSMISYSALTAYAGKLVDAAMIGEVQSLVSLTLDLSEVAGPPLFGWVLKWGIQHENLSPWMPNISFAIGGLSVLASMAVMLTLPSLELAQARVTEEKQRTGATPLHA